MYSTASWMSSMLGAPPGWRWAMTRTACAARRAASSAPYSPVAAPARCSAARILAGSNGWTLPSRLTTREIPDVVASMEGTPIYCYWRPTVARPAGTGSTRGVDAGQVLRGPEAQMHARALSGSGLDLEIAADLPHEAVDLRQPEAGAGC